MLVPDGGSFGNMSVVQYNGNNGKGGPTGFGSGGIGSPQMYGPPIKEKGPSMSTVISDNMAVAVAKTFRTAHKVQPRASAQVQHILPT